MGEKSKPERDDMFEPSRRAAGAAWKGLAGCLSCLGGWPGLILLIIGVVALVRMESAMHGSFLEVQVYSRALVATGALIGFGCAAAGNRR